MRQYVGGVFTWKTLPRAWEWVESVSKETVHALAALQVRAIFEQLMSRTGLQKWQRAYVQRKRRIIAVFTEDLCHSKCHVLGSTI